MDSEKESELITRDTLENSFHLKSDQLSLSQYPVDPSKEDLSALWKRPRFYSEGNGVKLKYIRNVAFNIEAAPDSFIEIMHRILYLHADEKPNMRRNILEFSGLKCDIGTVNYVCRMKILSVLSTEHLIIICHVLCLPIWQYSKPFLADSIMNFLLVPQMIDMKEKALPISSEEFALSFDCSKVDEIISPEAKAAETEEIEILPDIHVSEENPQPSSKETVPFDNMKATQGKITETRCTEAELEIVPDVGIPEQTSVVPTHGHHLDECGNQPFSKIVDVPNVLQACQNYDYRYQRELLKSGVTLTLNTDDYLEHAIGDDDAAFRLACAKYMRNYHADRRQQASKLSPGQQYQETEEQAVARRAQNAMRMRNYRQSLRALETEEQAAERRAQNALRMRNYRRFKRELEPELAAERRAQNAQRMRNYRKIKRELEPELAAVRRAQNALRMRNYRKNKRQQEPE